MWRTNWRRVKRTGREDGEVAKTVIHARGNSSFNGGDLRAVERRKKI